MVTGAEGRQDAGEELEARLRALAAEVEAAGIPPHLEELARRLEAALAARQPAPPAEAPETPAEAGPPPLARG